MASGSNLRFSRGPGPLGLRAARGVHQPALVGPSRGLSALVGGSWGTSALTLSPSEKETEEPNTPWHPVGVGGEGRRECWQASEYRRARTHENPLCRENVPA